MHRYQSLRAALLWVLGCIAIYLLLDRYDLLPAAPAGEGYLAGLGKRFLDSTYYQLMGLSVLGLGLYALVVLVASARLVRTLHSSSPPAFAIDGAIARLAGLPADLCYDAKTRKIFVDTGADYATGLLRDAAVIFPAIGFIGTVVGVSVAISGLSDVIETGNTQTLLDGLRVAFDTTFLGLVASVLLTAFVFLIQSRITLLRAYSST